MRNFEEQKRYERAKDRVIEIKKFYNNLISYILIIGFLAGVNYYSSGENWDHPWFLWAALGWGIGLTIHAIKAFRVNPMFNKDWEERKIRKYMEEEQDNQKQLWE
ncbi:histidine kinase [Aquimarina sp. AD10]|uniref:Histidine kinase n=1 Tax=Aquimarina aggregata TaxID=1642818 RepID=A0A162XSR2_9FLAO|nr:MULTISPECIES: 2TM domain-containing protein [Aquimarina]AXT60312.1 histidine kinase [Aquimarina sp. AD10]KZS38749.1 histidine kinase [Aquimarina aggregata]RKN01253.1 histidine kinase [Aquimarina sp. AD10]